MLCTHKHDRRSKQCCKCRMVNNHPRLGTGKGWKLHSTGYLMGSIAGKHYYQHRYIMEQYLGRKLNTEEHVHHINHDKTDNRLENLELLSASDHSREHIKPRAKQMSMKGHAARWSYSYL